MLFIDASREFADDKKQNRLRPEDIEKIVSTFEKFKTVPQVRLSGQADGDRGERVQS